MAGALLYLSYIGIVLLVGLLSTAVSKKIRIPNILLLLVFGIIVGNVSFEGSPLISFPDSFLSSMAVLALAVIVFDSSSRLKIREFDSLSIHALKLVFVFLVINTVLLGFVTHVFIGISLPLAGLFGVVMAATAPAAIMASLGSVKSKVFNLLEIESIINTPLVVLIPFLIIDFLESGVSGGLVSQLRPFSLQFIAGIGAGVLIGLILFKLMRKKYSVTLSPLVLITAAILTYTLAESLGGNGVLAVTTAGLFFGNVYIKHKRKLQEFSATFALFLEILVFVLIGLVIKVPLTIDFFVSSLFLFLFYLAIRFFVVHAALTHDFSFKEKLFMSLNIPKGIAVAVVVFTLSTVDVVGISAVNDLILAFLVYSIVLSSFVTRFSKFFTKIEAIPKEKNL